MRQNKKSLVIEHFQKGCTWAEAAEALGVCRSTIFRWSQSDPEFAKAIEEAKGSADNEVEAVTFANACDPDPAHNTLRMFWLNSRKGYKTRTDITTGDKPFRFVDRANNPRDAHLIPIGSNGNGKHSGNGVAP